jgi:hypothetical protein
MNPIGVPSAQEMVSRMPDAARDDMMEWYENKDLGGLLQFVLGSEMPLSAILNGDIRIIITDDRPYNEYYLLRRETDRIKQGTYAEVS